MLHRSRHQRRSAECRHRKLLDRFDRRGCPRCGNKNPADYLVAVLADEAVCSSCMKPTDQVEGILISPDVPPEKIMSAFIKASAILREYFNASKH
jgi:hypothetical protein